MDEHVQRIALVTGAASGIGRASALALAGLGAHVVVGDRDCAGGERTVEMIDALGRTSEFQQLDVTDSSSVASVIDGIIATHGRLDWAHNNAGVFRTAPSFVDMTTADFDLMIKINLKGVFLCMRAELAVMRAQGFGSIVNTSSAAGVIGTPRTPGYSASKHGVLGLTRSAAREYAAQEIRINAVCPGSVNTPMVTANLVDHPEVLQQIVEMQPGGRLAEPDEVAAAVAWLCSDAASFVSGSALLVAGGAVNR